MARGDKERRKHPRTARGFDNVAVQSDDGLINRIENISSSGVLCHTRRPVAEMTKMSIVLDLPNPISREIEAEGIVVRCAAEDDQGETFKVAILYTRMSDDDQHAIRDYVEHHLDETGHA